MPNELLPLIVPDAVSASATQLAPTRKKLSLTRLLPKVGSSRSDRQLILLAAGLICCTSIDGSEPRGEVCRFGSVDWVVVVVVALERILVGWTTLACVWVRFARDDAVEPVIGVKELIVERRF